MKPTGHCIPLFKPLIERELFSISVLLPVHWAHTRVCRPCAGLRCGIPLSDYRLRLSVPSPSLCGPSLPHLTFRLSPCALNRVEMGTSLFSYMHTHILIPVVQWPIQDKRFGVELMGAFHIDYTHCATLCLVTLFRK